MKLHLTAAALALAFASNAFAATATTGSINPGSATDGSTSGGYVTGNPGSGNFTANKYNGTDVLVGATFSASLANEPVNFSRSGNCFSNCTNPSGSAYGTGTLALSTTGLTGVTATGTSAIITSGSVGNSGTTGTIASYSTTNASFTTQTQLNALYGSGTVSGSVAETLSVSKTAGSSNYSLRVNNDNDRTATVTYTYSTLAHANGSFNSAGVDNNTLNLDFGTMTAGTSPASLNFNLYNVLGSYGLQVVSITGPGGSAPFSLTGLTGTSNLAAGSFASGTVSMGSTTGLSGLYSGLWTITVADSASGNGAGKNLLNTNQLTLNVSANVTPVPEPESYAMLLAGLGMMGFVARRRQRNA